MQLCSKYSGYDVNLIKYIKHILNIIRIALSIIMTFQGSKRQSVSSGTPSRRRLVVITDVSGQLVIPSKVKEFKKSRNVCLLQMGPTSIIHGVTSQNTEDPSISVFLAIQLIMTQYITAALLLIILTRNKFRTQN